MTNISTITTALTQWLKNHPVELRLSYLVPLLGEGGSCSLFGELSDEPFQLDKVLTAEEQKHLWFCQSIVDWVQSNTQIDWFGIYLKRGHGDNAVLTKLAYYGEPSRAEFPLTQEFASISNNSFVGLNGQRRTINDVASYVAEGGEYYTCDPKVKSELCWPILSPNKFTNRDKETSCRSPIVGIIDAESFKANSFDDDTLIIFEVICNVLNELINNPDSIKQPNTN